jgi:tetratricopeptide (TPR) repeat protein
LAHPGWGEADRALFERRVEAAGELVSNDSRARVCCALVQSLFRAGEEARAGKLLKNAVSLAENSQVRLSACCELIKAVAETGRYRRAFSLAKRFEKTCGEEVRPFSFWIIARVLFEAGEITRAISLAKRILRDHEKIASLESPPDPGKEEYGPMKRCVITSDDMITVDEPGIYLFLARAQAKLGRPKQVLANLEKISDPTAWEKAETVRLTAESYARAGDKKTAAEVLRRFSETVGDMEKADDKVDALEEIGKALAGMGEKDAAMDTFEKALALIGKSESSCDLVREHAALGRVILEAGCF